MKSTVNYFHRCELRLLKLTAVRMGQPWVRVARSLGLGGLQPEVRGSGPQFVINDQAEIPSDWAQMEGDGTVRRLMLDVGQVNNSFASHADPRAAQRPISEPADTTFIELQTALVSVPAIGKALLGQTGYSGLEGWLDEGDQAIAVMGRGLYSFKGSGYVRGGIFDRIVLIQDDISVRFRDRDHRRLSGLEAPGAPQFTETDLFRIPADSGFDPTKPFRIQLLVQRDVGPVEHTTVTQEERQAQSDLWKRIWADSTLKIVGLSAMLLLLTGVFFFQSFATRNERAFYIFRMGFLTVTLVFLGWYANAQLSVVNLMALFGSLISGFSWQAFLLDPWPLLPDEPAGTHWPQSTSAFAGR